ncbi:MAG: ferrous iron transport protein B [Desulfobacterales bacterium]|jgi:ferrous iron transport protein B|nr:ferrous iron transport protein B [Desulfobacterales bacterium]
MGNSQIRIALTGNPNSGKTTIFNQLTGTRQKVGNWPGVTVEKKEGDIQKFGYDIQIVDLPGTYSLTPFSIEEIVARDFILEEKPDVVIDIIDASNLERNLYLANQLRELDTKVIFALNMADVARARGFKIDAQKLSQLLGVPVVFTVGNKGEGLDALIQTAVDIAHSPLHIPEERKVRYSKDIESAIADLKEFIKARSPEAFPYNYRWTAIKLLEDDKIVKKRIRDLLGASSDAVCQKAGDFRGKLAGLFNEDLEIVMTDERYGFIAGIIKEVLSASSLERVDISRNIDRVLTNKFVGFPIFIFFIWAMFQLTFTLGAYPMSWLDTAIAYLTAMIEHAMPGGIIKSLVIDGVIGGVGSIIVFLPNILLLFFCIALFEDTGYMARAAFLMDRIMHLIGLHGKSFIPMLMGFGCNVPAIMATRTLESRKDRILTILITPFMSCSARLPVYIVLAGTFFAAKAGTVIFMIYLLGIVLAILTGRMFRTVLLRGEDAPFVMELPPYRVPMIRSLLIHMWDRSKMFLRKMGGIILAGSIIVWALSSFPRQIEYSMDYEAAADEVRKSFDQKIKSADGFLASKLESERDKAIHDLNRQRNAERAEKSYIGRIGKLIEPVFAPVGIDWRGSVALLTGFVAKEIVVSTMGVLYSVEGDSQSDALHSALRDSGMTPLSALSMMVFVLLYVPCLATIGAIARETGAAKWAVFNILYTTAVAWIMAFIVYQGGRLLGH